MRDDWLDRPVHDELFLRTVPGAVDYLADSLQSLVGAEARIIKRRPDGARVDYRGPLSALVGNRFFSSCAVVLDEPTGSPDELTGAAALTPRPGGVLAALATAGPIAFRVGDIGPNRFAVRDLLADDDGWRNEPGDWELNLVLADPLLVAEIGALHTTRRFGRLERLPASTTPVISAVLTRLLKVEPGDVVLDPFCGAGTNLLYVAAMSAPGLIVGADRDRRALAAAATNLDRTDLPRRLLRSDAAALPVADRSVDRVVANLPFGKRVGSHSENEQLYPAFLRELVRVMAGKARATLLTEDKRLLRVWLNRVRGLRLVKEVLLESGGAHPSIFVVTNRQTPARHLTRGPGAARR